MDTIETLVMMTTSAVPTRTVAALQIGHTTVYPMAHQHPAGNQIHFGGGVIPHGFPPPPPPAPAQPPGFHFGGTIPVPPLPTTAHGISGHFGGGAMPSIPPPPIFNHPNGPQYVVPNDGTMIGTTVEDPNMVPANEVHGIERDGLL